MLLADVRNRLDGYLYSQNPTRTLADAEPTSGAQGHPYHAAQTAVLRHGDSAAGVCLGRWYLHDQSRALRNAILARRRRSRTNQHYGTLPQPLPQILSEGWLEVRADPRGWLLIFTSDGAFATGQSKLSEEFKETQH